MVGNLEETFEFVLSRWYYTSGFFFLFFSLLYFSGVLLTEFIIKRFKSVIPLNQVVFAKKDHQISTEIRNSLLSILVFSLQAIVFQYLYAKDYIQVRFDSSWHCLWEIPLLFLWNEVHFYAMHWLLHRPWFFKHVHKVHHWSKEPTSYSIYSFHWFEAFLLGTVIFFPVLLHDFQVYSILSLPVMSILINLLGHCNHEIPSLQDPTSFSRFTFRHSMHHKGSRGNYGFMLPFLDKIFNTQVPPNKQ